VQAVVLEQRRKCDAAQTGDAAIEKVAAVEEVIHGGKSVQEIFLPSFFVLRSRAWFRIGKKIKARKLWI
jgi:hypothetical protein